MSIVLVGVGDGPWDTMRQFDDNIPARAFDNFQVITTPNKLYATVYLSLSLVLANELVQQVFVFG